MSSFPKYKTLYGVPHCHSSLSTGEEIPGRILSSARDRGLDFVILSDHNTFLIKDTKLKSSKIMRWAACQKVCASFNKKYKDFLALTAFEAKSHLYGHFNIIGSSNFFSSPIRNINTFMLWLWANPSIVAINHPHSAAENIPCHKFLKESICLIEVGNGCLKNNYCRFEKRYYSMLDLGWKVGAINGQDNHKKDVGVSDNLTAVLCREKSISSLLEALKYRRTYSTESRSLKLLFSINKAFMGSTLKINEGKKLNFNIWAHDSENHIDKIEVITSTGKVIRTQDFPPEKNISYLLSIKASREEKWYVVKVYQANEKISFSSPIFIEIEKSAK